MSELQKAALSYANLGWKVFPVKPADKIPLTAHGVKDATTDAAQIEAWWTQWPDANIGFACGGENGIHVIDVDVDITKGIDGWKTINDLLASGKTFPRTVCQNTPRGGAHFFYRSNVKPKNKNSFMHGVDIRSEGYYVLLPPSVNPNGRMYGWADRMSPWEHKLAEYPDFMRPAERTPCSTQTPCFAPTQQAISSIDPPDINVIERAKRYLATCDAAVQGQAGHDKLLWAAGCLVHGFLLPDDIALEILEHEYNPRCIPPWDMSNPTDAKDFRRKVSEARKNPPDKPLGWLLNGSAYAPPSDKLSANIAEFITKVQNSGIIPAASQTANPAAKATSATTPQAPDPISVPVVDAVSAAVYLTQLPPSVEPVITGRIDKGNKVFVVGQSKARKSFLTLQLALCLASGKSFLDWGTSRPQTVLLLQFELQPGYYHRRVRMVAKACGIKPDDLSDRLQIVNLRGKDFLLKDIQALAKNYDVVIIDPLYKLLDREGADEISAPDVARVLGKIDKIAESGPAVILVHHAVKGHIGDRQTIDRAGGSGIIARDFDCLFTLSPHADHSNEWTVLEAVLRNHRSPEAQTIEFREGKFIVREDVPSEVKTSRHINRQRQTGQSTEVMAIQVGEWLTGKMKTADVQDRIKNEFSVGRDKVNEVVRQLERNGFVRKKDKAFQGHWTISPPDKLTKLTDEQTSLFSH